MFILFQGLRIQSFFFLLWVFRWPGFTITSSFHAKNSYDLSNDNDSIQAIPLYLCSIRFVLFEKYSKNIFKKTFSDFLWLLHPSWHSAELVVSVNYKLFPIFMMENISQQNLSKQEAQVIRIQYFLFFSEPDQQKLQRWHFIKLDWEISSTGTGARRRKCPSSNCCLGWCYLCIYQMQQSIYCSYYQNKCKCRTHIHISSPTDTGTVYYIRLRR